MIFSCFFFQKNLDVKKIRSKKINRTSISQPYSEVLSGYIQGLQIWSPGLTAQIFFFLEFGFVCFLKTWFCSTGGLIDALVSLK